MKYSISDLNIYGKQEEYGIAENILQAIGGFDRGLDSGEKHSLERKLNKGIAEILAIADLYKLKGNLWQSFLAWLIIMDENNFSLSWEHRRGEEGSLAQFILKDFEILRRLFFLDFTRESRFLMEDYRTTVPYKKSSVSRIGAQASDLAVSLADSMDNEDFCWKITSFYRRHGVGLLGLNKAFYLSQVEASGPIRFAAVDDFDTSKLSDLWGYDIQKQQLIKNTEAFLDGSLANNVLLYGDSGTGKSTSVKAILNEYHDQGLRMIGLYKHEMQKLPQIIAEIKNRNYRFIIYMDDLSFEDFETEYKYLKAIIEGGLESKPNNVLIYATSNRRHLIREVWSDREDMNDYEIHRSDTTQEKLSLADRFGLTINFSKPLQEEYFQIILHLAKINGLVFTESELLEGAKAWSVMNGGMSGRTARQYINSLQGPQS